MKNKEPLKKITAILLALLVWQAGAMLLNQQILLVSPLKVVHQLGGLIIQPSFWHAIGFSFKRITLGFVFGVVSGSFLGILSYFFSWLEWMLWPYMAVIKATPVASFIILCLIWLNASSLPIFISFLMVLPIVYTNVLTALKNTDKKMLEMAHLFHLDIKKQFLFIYIPQLKPYFLSAFSVSLGLAWKAGIAAEIIGIPSGSIGDMLYQAKLYLNSADLFAWTAVIVTISILLEKVLMSLLQKSFLKMEGL